MQRFELYVDRNQRVTLNEYENINSIHRNASLKNIDAYELIKKISRVPIRKVHELQNDIDLLLIHRNFILEIKDYDKVLDRESLKPVLNNIKRYYEHEKLKRIKGRKVTRKNKYVTNKIIVAGITLTIVATSLISGISSTMASDKGIDKIDTSLYVDVASTVLDDINNNQNNEMFISINDDVSKVFINYVDNSETEKAFKTKKDYGQIIKKYSDIYGLDFKLMTALATQERGVHCEVLDVGGAIGLMQIQYNVWSNKELTAYNFQTDKYEKIIVDPEKLSDVDYNIKVGCMIFQTCMRDMDYNVLAGLQCYNMGIGNMNNILNNYALDTNKTKEEILKNQKDCGWLDYRNIISVGDQKYIENVLGWLGPEAEIELSTKDGEIVNFCVSSQDKVKKVY